MVKPSIFIKEINVQWVERSCFVKKCYSNLVISCTFKEKMLWGFDIFSTGEYSSSVAHLDRLPCSFDKNVVIRWFETVFGCTMLRKVSVNL